MSSPAGHAARVAAVFDGAADTYDSVGVDFFGPIADVLVGELHPARGERLLDVGCGRGAVLLAAAEALGPTGRAVGIDISASMVSLVRAEAQARQLTQVDVRIDDAQHPSGDDGPFDVVASSLVLFFLADPAAALNAWRDLLVAGGRLGVTTFGPQDPRWREIDEVFVPYLPPALADARTSGATGPFGSDDAMADLVAAAGFVDVRTVTQPLEVRFAGVEQWHAFSWSTGQRAMWLAVPESERPRVRAAAEERLLGHATPDGSIVFEQVVRHTLARRPGEVTMGMDSRGQ